VRGRKSGRLVFDSDRAAARVGRRSADGCGRMLLFRADRYAVDVVVHAPGNELRLYHGQVVDERSGAPVAAAGVSLDDDGAVRTDEFGQFSLSDLVGAGPRRLRIQVSDGDLECPIPTQSPDG
jgi:hypothetical protein